jgi:uncharacterized membrane protein
VATVSGPVTSGQSHSAVQSIPRVRIEPVDLLRGLVMVIMALDHTRESFTYIRRPPEIVQFSYLALFFTRWITHFCAPAFFFLAGTGAFLSASRGKKWEQTAAFLAKRGVWLILLEFTLIDLGWTFVPGMIFAGVVYALGACMLILAAMVWLPPKWVGAIGVAIIVLHHLFDRVQADSLGSFKYVWMLLHQPGFVPIRPPDIFFINLYVLVPWCGVMAAGYGFGVLLLKSPDLRRKWIFWIGAAATALFFLLRFTHGYGQPPRDAVMLGVTAGPYVPQATLEKSIIAFFNVNKYPPSLQFLLMTLGPSLMLLAWFDRMNLQAPANWLWRKILVFGQVPMFYYILHIWLIHVLALVIAMVRGQSYGWLLKGGIFTGLAPNDVYGYGLPTVYLLWLAVVVMLYPVCAWYADYKRTHKQWWLRYL